MNKNTKVKIRTREEAEKISNAKSKALSLALQRSSSRVVEYRALALVDLQGIYLKLHKVLSGINFPIESGAVIGKFAALQINEIFKQIPRIVQRKYGKGFGVLQDLVDGIKIELVDGRPHLAEQLNVLQEGVYIDLRPKFEVFYALPPLSEIEWKLRREAKKGDQQARIQLEKIELGVLKKSGTFERDYKYYGDFVETIKENINCHGSEEGFFSYNVGAGGINYFDEKEVDTRITIRAIESLYEKQADGICIISSDQDFLPIKEKCEKFDVEFYQADAANFTSDDRIGRKIGELLENFIPGTLKPEWPLEILCDLIALQDASSIRAGKPAEKEMRALASLHNMINEFVVEIEFTDDHKAAVKVSRPLEPSIETRTSGKGMRQVRISRLEY